jgi:hypothetical protein
LTNLLHRRRIRLGKVASQRLGYASRLDELDQPDLRGLVAIPGSGLQLRDHTRPSLQNGDRVYITLLIEDLRHADFFTQNSCN